MGEPWMKDIPGAPTGKSMGRRAARIIAGNQSLWKMAIDNFSNKKYTISTHWSGVDGTLTVACMYMCTETDN